MTPAYQRSQLARCLGIVGQNTVTDHDACNLDQPSCALNGLFPYIVPFYSVNQVGERMMIACRLLASKDF